MRPCVGNTHRLIGAAPRHLGTEAANTSNMQLQGDGWESCDSIMSAPKLSPMPEPNGVQSSNAPTVQQCTAADARAPLAQSSGAGENMIASYYCALSRGRGRSWCSAGAARHCWGGCRCCGRLQLAISEHDILQQRCEVSQGEGSSGRLPDAEGDRCRQQGARYKTAESVDGQPRQIVSSSCFTLRWRSRRSQLSPADHYP